MYIVIKKYLFIIWKKIICPKR